MLKFTIHYTINAMNREIIERASGYWIVDEHGVIDGAFIEYDEALKVLANLNLEAN